MNKMQRERKSATLAVALMLAGAGFGGVVPSVLARPDGESLRQAQGGSAALWMKLVDLQGKGDFGRSPGRGDFPGLSTTKATGRRGRM